MKAEHLDRQTLHLIVLQLQNDFALLRYFLFSAVETISNKDIAVKKSATSPLIIPNPNPNPTSSAFPLPCTDDPKLRRSTPVGAVGPPRAKTNNSANAYFQPTPKTQGAFAITAQNLSSRITKLEKLFADEIATYKLRKFNIKDFASDEKKIENEIVNYSVNWEKSYHMPLKSKEKQHLLGTESYLVNDKNGKREYMVISSVSDSCSSIINFS